MFTKMMFLKISQVSQENTCVGVSNTGVFLWNWNSCEVFKNTFFYRTPLVAASELFVAKQLNIQLFSVIMITLGYNQHCYGNTVLLSPSLYKNIRLLSKLWPSSSKVL